MDIRIDVSRFFTVIWSDVKRWLAAWPGAWLRRRWHAYIARRRKRDALRRGIGAVDGPSGDLWLTPGNDLGQEIAGPTHGRMVWVPPGEFLRGDDEPGGGPPYRVRISNGFWLMECLVTNAQYAQYLNKLTESHPKRASLDPVAGCQKSEIALEDGHYQPLGGRDNYPVVGATWQAAHDCASYYGLRLPTEAEWEWAARGPESFTYPWGDCWDPIRCCCRENQGRQWHWERKQYVDASDETAVTCTSPIGSFPEGESWCGALDMAGNLMEWCQDWYAEYPDSEDTAQDPCGPSQGNDRVVRGGNWYYGEEDCRTTDRRHHSPPETTNNSVGFRCAYTPKPESANRHRPGH